MNGREKLRYLNATLPTTDSTRTVPRLNPGLRGDNRLLTARANGNYCEDTAIFFQKIKTLRNKLA
jgi:hypothetical protein